MNDFNLPDQSRIVETEERYRVGFADALRGIAALTVIVGHYLGVFWTWPSAIFDLTGMPAHGLPVPLYAQLVNIPYISWGAFGVGIFFIISGFVIPFSFNSYGRLDFLVARAFRIYPTYLVGLSIGLCILYLGSLVLHSEFPNTPKQVLLSYALGYRDIAWSKPVDGVAWTLEIELKFYVLCMLIAPLLQRASTKVMLVPLGLFVATFIVSSTVPTAGTPYLNFVALESPYLLFMFIGVAFNLFYRNKVSAVTTSTLIVALSLMFGFCLTYGFFKSPILPSYALALITFTAAFKYPKLVARIPTISFWAKISYPLYVVHALSGYVMLNVLLHFSVKAWISLVLTFVTVSIIALALHRLVETPSHILGKRLARRLRNYLNARHPVQSNMQKTISTREDNATRQTAVN